MTDIVYQPSETGHWKTLFAQKNLLLGSHNLNPGEELIATIKSVEVSEIVNTNGQTERVPICSFENCPPMVLNITNCTVISNLYGPIYDAWVGHSVQIYATEVKAFGGGTTQGLRIREAIPDIQQDVTSHENALRSCTTMNDLQRVFMSIPKHLKPKLVPAKNECKESINASA